MPRKLTPVCVECGNLVPEWRGDAQLVICQPCFDRLADADEIRIPESALREYERRHPELQRRKRPD